jgi:hypothetical protein
MVPKKTWNKAHGDKPQCSGALDYFIFTVPFLFHGFGLQIQGSNGPISIARWIQTQFPYVPIMFDY